MFKNVKPSVMLYPVPAVMVSCQGKTGGLNKPNIVTIAWAGTVCSDPPIVSVSLRKSRFSHAQITDSKEFVINLVNEALVKAADYCGVKSGRDVDKFKECKLTPIGVEELSFAPAIAESPLCLCCKLKDVRELGSHDMFLGEIVATKVQEVLFDEAGKICLDRAGLIAYNHGNYFSLGEHLGFFGYSIASPEALARRNG